MTFHKWPWESPMKKKFTNLHNNFVYGPFTYICRNRFLFQSKVVVAVVVVSLVNPYQAQDSSDDVELEYFLVVVPLTLNSLDRHLQLQWMRPIRILIKTVSSWNYLPIFRVSPYICLAELFCLLRSLAVATFLEWSCGERLFMESEWWILWRGDVTGVSFDNGNVVRTLNIMKENI